MSDEDKNPRPPAPHIVDGSLDPDVKAALEEQHSRWRRAAIISSSTVPPSVPPPLPMVAGYTYQDEVSTFIAWEEQHRRALIAPTSGSPANDYLISASDAYPTRTGSHLPAARPGER